MTFTKLATTIQDYLSVLKVSITYSFRQDTAFIFNNWANILSTIAYTLTWILLIEVIFTNTDEIAGYGRDEMLVFALISQIAFYLVTGLCTPNIARLLRSVNSGSLDLLLTKPFPTLFYVMTNYFNIVSLLRDALVPTSMIFLTINFSNVNLTPATFLAGMLIMLLGVLSMYAVLMIAALPVFWVGEGEAVVDLVSYITFDMLDDIPYEGFAIVRPLQMVFTFIIPLLVAGGVSTSVLVGKTDTGIGLLTAAITTAALLALLSLLWRKALKSYSSASS